MTSHSGRLMPGYSGGADHRDGGAQKSVDIRQVKEASSLDWSHLIYMYNRHSTVRI